MILTKCTKETYQQHARLAAHNIRHNLKWGGVITAVLLKKARGQADTLIVWSATPIVPKRYVKQAKMLLMQCSCLTASNGGNCHYCQDRNNQGIKN